MYPRVLYFVVFGWLSWTGGRYTAPFLEDECHFTEIQVGVALAIQSLLMSLLAPHFGRMADRLQMKYSHGRIYVLQTGIICGSLAFLMHGLPRVRNYLRNDARKSELLSSWGFEYHLVLRIAIAMSQSMVMPVLDGITLADLESRGIERSQYGRERLFGAISWMVAHGLLGPALDWGGFKALYGAALAALLLGTSFVHKYTKDLDRSGINLSDNPSLRNQANEADEAQSLLEIQEDNQLVYEAMATIPLDADDLPYKQNHLTQTTNSDSDKASDSSNNSVTNIRLFMSMFGNIYGMGFLVCFVTLSMGTSVVEQLIFIFFGFLGSSNTMCGITVFVTVVFEIPLFHFAPTLLNKFGASTLLYVSCFAYVIRVMGYTVIPQHQPYWVLLLEPLHGVTYACAKTSSVEFVAALVPPGQDAAGQGILFLFRGLGICFGILMGGILEDMLGSRIMYRCMAAVVASGIVSFALSDFSHRRRCNQETA